MPDGLVPVVVARPQAIDQAATDKRLQAAHGCGLGALVVGHDAHARAQLGDERSRGADRARRSAIVEAKIAALVCSKVRAACQAGRRSR